MGSGPVRPSGTIAIVGGGASGLLAATHLLRAAQRPLDIVVADSHGPLGAGVAYSTRNRRHLLNAPVNEMSAFGDRPLDLLDWAHARNHLVDPAGFVPRSLYREYLSDVLAAALRRAGPMSGLSWIREEVVALTRHDGGDGTAFVLGLAGGGHIRAAHVVLAVGPPPGRAPWSGDLDDDLRANPALVEDPWAAGALDAIGQGARVLLLGTGLTMVDVALSLGSPAQSRTLYARSRRGLVPIAHSDAPGEAWQGRIEAASTARELVRALRVAAEKVQFAGGDWRAVVSGVRRQVPELWSSLPREEQRRFLRLGLRHWEVHRHRMAPEVGAWFSQLRHDGRLDIAQGRLLGLRTSGGMLRAEIGHGGEVEVLEVDAVVNCTGATGSYADGSRLISHLVRSGLAEVDDLGLGLRADSRGDLVGADGTVDHALHVLGWARRGQLLESTAIPELRCQAEQLAGRIAWDLP